MLVLPLGLGTKLKSRPVVTIAICLLWVAVFLGDRSESKIFGGIFGVASATGVRDRARDLFIDYCKSRSGKTADCAKYSILVWTGYPGKGELPKSAAFDDEADDADDAPPQKVPPKKDPSSVFFTRMEAEHTVAAKLKKDLLRCQDEKRCFVYKDIVWRFLDMSHHRSKSLARLGSFGPYMRAMQDYRLRLRSVCAENACLVQSNITAASLAAAQVRHGGFMHLFGNMLVFIVFGIYAEQRTGRLLYLLTVVVGGTLGMAVHAAFFSSGDTIALGGSANVSAAMGMFFVFFFRQNMRFLCVLPRKVYAGTSFPAPVAYTFPLFFVLSDVIGGLDSGFSDLSTGNVAHFAHLTGFAVGAAVAFVVTRLRPLPLPFIFESELADMRALEQAKDPAEALEKAALMARYNPDNVHAMEVGCALFLRWAAVASPNENAALFDRGRAFLTAHLQTVCAVNVRKNELRYACRLLSQVPLYMPYVGYLARLGQVPTLALADFALLEGHPVLSLRLYDFYLMKFPASRQRAAVEQTVLNALACVAATAENRGALAAFAQHHPDSPLVPLIAAWQREKRIA